MSYPLDFCTSWRTVGIQSRPWGWRWYSACSWTDTEPSRTYPCWAAPSAPVVPIHERCARIRPSVPETRWTSLIEMHIGHEIWDLVWLKWISACYICPQGIRSDNSFSISVVMEGSRERVVASHIVLEKVCLNLLPSKNPSISIASDDLYEIGPASQQINVDTKVEADLK